MTVYLTDSAGGSDYGAISTVGDEQSAEKSAALPKGRLLCVACGAPVSDDKERISIAGSHEHRFSNPHGMSFDIVCFASAAGCRQQGAATEEFTWFAGYGWQVAVCGSCGEHLGWRYRSLEHGFHGLIAKRLVTKQ
jgi:hypothetical protein